MKKLFLTTAALVFGGVAAILLLNAAVDPYQFYRMRAGPPGFLDNPWFQNPGLLKNGAYDSVIIGTSMAREFIPSRILRRTGWQVMKAASHGSLASEQALLAKLALRNPATVRVMWCLDFLSFQKGEFPDEFPAYLYDGNPFNDLPYLLSGDTARLSFRFLFPGWFGAPALDDLDHYNTTAFTKKYGRKQVLDVWRLSQGRDRSRLQTAKDFDPVRMGELFDEQVAPVIRSRPGVNFAFFFAPYAIPYFKSLEQGDPAIIGNLMEFKRHVFASLRGAGNAELFDFQKIGSVTHDFGYYSDLMHFSDVLSDWIVDRVRAREYAATEGNFEAGLGALQRQIKDYDIARDEELLRAQVEQEKR